MEQPRGRPQRIGFGAAVITTTVFAMALADAIVKYASTAIPLWQIFVVRSLIAIPILAGALLLGRRHAIDAGALGWALLRGLLLTMMYVATYAAAPVLPLTMIAAALYAGPLFIALLAGLVIGEAVGRRRWVAIAIGFIGVLAILRPGTDGFSALTLIPVIAALLYAVAAILTRTKCGDTLPLLLALALNYSLLGVGTVATAALLLWRPDAAASYPFLLGPWIAMGPPEWALLLVLAVLIVAIGAGLATAYQAAPPAVVAAFDYSYLVFAALWGFVFFGEVPDAATGIGMAMIACGGLLALAPADSAASGTPCADRKPPRDRGGSRSVQGD